MHRVYRRTGVTGGTAQADSLQAFLVINTFAPGGSAYGVPVFKDRHERTDETYFFGDTPANEQLIHDPFYFCCAFGPDEAIGDDGWDEGEIIHARWNQYNSRYEVAYPFGLVRPAQLGATLTVGSSADASILAHKRDGTTTLGGIGVTLYHWQNSGDNIASGEQVQAWYETSSRRWWTSAFYRAP